jgi:pimeloyl-ACP methyl ester carboxylesterase
VTAAIPGFEERFADVKAVRLRYFIGGEGPALVLVHGLTGAAANWAELAPRFARRRRVLVPDLPGHGGSSPLPAAPNMDAFSERVRLVADREGMLPAALFGHSMGGLVALRLALRRPQDVTGVAVAASAGIGSATRRAQFWVAVFGFMRPGRLVAPFRGLMARYPPLRGPVFNRYQVADPLSLSPGAVEGFLAASPLHSDVVTAGRVLVRDDPRVDLAGVGCSCIMLWGARDLQVPIDDAFEYARRLRAPLRTIVDAGHLLIGERPDAVVEAVESFLDSLLTEHERAPQMVGEAGLGPAKA